MNHFFVTNKKCGLTNISKVPEDNYQYYALAFLFAYRTFTLFLNIDKGQNICFLLELFLLVFTYNTDPLFRRVCKYKLNVVWLLLVLYHWINHGLQGVPHEYSYWAVLISPFQCYFLLIWTCFLAKKNFQKTLEAMLWGYLIFITLGAWDAWDLTGNASMYFYSEERLSGSIHTTQLGATAGLVFFILALLKHKRHMSSLRILVYSILPIMIILAAGSRNGLIIMICGLASLYMSSYLRKLSIRNILILIIFSVILCIAVSQLLEMTYVGERLMDTKEQAMNAMLIYGRTGTFIDYLGDRAWYYIVGFSNFMENPFWGIGYYNFRYYNNTEWIVHPEYILQLAEGGIVATVLFVYFMSQCLYFLFKIIIEKRTNISFTLLMFFITILIVCMSATITHDIQYWPLIGISMTTIMDIDRNGRLMRPLLKKITKHPQY